jgi:hypothetical protein
MGDLRFFTIVQGGGILSFSLDNKYKISNARVRIGTMQVEEDEYCGYLNRSQQTSDVLLPEVLLLIFTSLQKSNLTKVVLDPESN